MVLGQPGAGDPEDRLPLAVGHWWHFTGSGTGDYPAVVDNSVAITGTRVLSGAAGQGVTALVMRESNPAGDGMPDESTIVKDANGVATLSATAVGGPLIATLTPAWELRFPLQAGQSFVQYSRQSVDFGADLDGDGRNETIVDLQSTVQVVGNEAVTVPAGSHPDALRIDRRMTLAVVLSRTSTRIESRTSGSAWFARGIGWVKRTQTIVVADTTSSLTEELDAYYVNGVAGGLAVKAPEALVPATLAADQTRYCVFPAVAEGDTTAAIAGTGSRVDLSAPIWGPCQRGDIASTDGSVQDCQFLHTGGSAVVRAKATADTRFVLWLVPQPVASAPTDEQAELPVSVPTPGKVGPRGQSTYAVRGLAPGNDAIAVVGITEDADLAVYADGTYSMQLDCTLRAPGDIGTGPSGCVTASTGDLYFRVRSGELNTVGAACSILVVPAP